jgi:hypothetical protein
VARRAPWEMRIREREQRRGACGEEAWGRAGRGDELETERSDAGRRGGSGWGKKKQSAHRRSRGDGRARRSWSRSTAQRGERRSTAVINKEEDAQGRSLATGKNRELQRAREISGGRIRNRKCEGEDVGWKKISWGRRKDQDVSRFSLLDFFHFLFLKKIADIWGSDIWI